MTRTELEKMNRRQIFAWMAKMNEAVEAINRRLGAIEQAVNEKPEAAPKPKRPARGPRGWLRERILEIMETRPGSTWAITDVTELVGATPVPLKNLRSEVGRKLKFMERDGLLIKRGVGAYRIRTGYIATEETMNIAGQPVEDLAGQLALVENCK